MKPNIQAFVKQALDLVKAMNNDERRAIEKDHRHSYVRGQLMLANPEMTTEEANALIDAAETKR